MVFGKHFTKYYLKYILFFAIGIGVLIWVDIVQLDIPELLGEIIDLVDIENNVITSDTMPEVVNKIKNIFLIVIVVFSGRMIWRLFIFGTSRRIEYDIRNVMFEHATNLSQDFYSHEKVGGMMTYFINDLAAIRMAYGPGLMMIIDTVFLGGVALYKMFKLNRSMTSIILIPILGMIVTMFMINVSMRRQFKKRQEKFYNLSDFTQENFSGISVIKAYVREDSEAKLFEEKNKELYDYNMGFVRRSVWSEITTSIAINIVILLIFGLGSYLIIKNDSNPNFTLTPGGLIEYHALFGSLIWPTRALARFLTISSQAQASASRITEFLDTEVLVKDSEDVIEVDSIEPSIKAINLSFSYPDEKETIVLDNVNFEIKPGEMVGILGKTGSGKTTLVDLLLRVYNVSEGMLYLGGYDIMKLKIKDVRNLVGYVPQDNFLFSDTISNNISFAYDNLSDEEIIEAAKLSDVYHNILDFKEGFDTVLGERGVTVSGGQKQRISIARALAKNPDILILDDSVSAVDTKTEETIISNLHKIRKNQTTIFIAHRISTVKDMDKIILLDDGKIVGIGTHEELLKTSPLYKDMVERQTLEDLVAGGVS